MSAKIILQSPKSSLAVLDRYTTSEETTLTLHCHDSVFEKATAVNDIGKPLFLVEGDKWGRSWSWRRKVFDAKTGDHLFDFRHESLNIKNRWVVEEPSGTKLCSLVHRNQITVEHSAIDAIFCNGRGDDVELAMRPQDHGAMSTYINLSGEPIAVIRKSIDNIRVRTKDLVKEGRDQSVWEMRVAAGVDLSMMMIMLLCRAEMGHVWAQ